MHSRFELRDEFRHNALIYQRIVLANTHLARIDCLAPQKPLCGKMNVGILAYDRGISATQLQCQGRKSLSGLLGDNPRHGRPPRVDDLIPFLLKKRSSLGNSTLDDTIS